MRPSLRPAHNDDPFARLIRTHGALVLSIARRVLGNDDDARAVLLEASAATHAAMANGSNDIAVEPATVLTRAAVRAILNRLTRLSPPHDIEALLPKFDASGAHASPVAAWPDVHGADDAGVGNAARLRSALTSLPPVSRVVYLLSDVEGWPLTAIASALEATEPAVRLLLHRARLALCGLLQAVPDRAHQR